MTLRSAQLPRPMVVAVVVQALALLLQVSVEAEAASEQRVYPPVQQHNTAVVVGPAVVRQLASTL